MNKSLNKAFVFFLPKMICATIKLPKRDPRVWSRGKNTVEKYIFKVETKLNQTIYEYR
jgi:hypothetical protein